MLAGGGAPVSRPSSSVERGCADCSLAYASGCRHGTLHHGSVRQSTFDLNTGHSVWICKLWREEIPARHDMDRVHRIDPSVDGVVWWCIPGLLLRPEPEICSEIRRGIACPAAYFYS